MSEPTVSEEMSESRSAGPDDLSRVSFDLSPVMKNPVVESRTRKREEYEMQLLGFHSRAVYVTLKSIIRINIRSKISKLCNALEEHELYSKDQIALKTSKEQLIKAYSTTSLSHLEAIKNVVNKYITVPNNVLADEDKLQRTQYTKAEVVDMRKKLEELQQRGKRATVLNAVLKEELQLIHKYLIHMDNIDKLIKIIDNSNAEIKMAHPNISDKMHQLIKDYNQFSSYFDKISISQKSHYNMSNDLKCVDYDMDTL